MSYLGKVELCGCSNAVGLVNPAKRDSVDLVWAGDEQ